MKWIHVREKKNRFSCPASFIENYDPDMNLEVNAEYWVFWSPDEEETPESFKTKQRRILRITDDILKRNKGVALPGYWKATLLMVRDSEEELSHALEDKRISIQRSTTAVNSTKTLLSDSAKADTAKRASKKIRQEAGKSNMKNVVKDPVTADDSTSSEVQGPTYQLRKKKFSKKIAGLSDSSDEDDHDFVGDDNSNSAVPEMVYKEMEETLKAKNDKLKDRLDSTKESHQKQLEELKRQLAAKDDLLRKTREREAALEGECLRLSLTKKSAPNVTNGGKSSQNDTANQPDADKNRKADSPLSPHKDYDINWDDNIFGDEEQPISPKDHNAAERNVISTSPITPKNTNSPASSSTNSSAQGKSSGLSESLLKKRKLILDKKPSKKTRKKEPETSFNTDDWKDEEWQETALLGSVKKGRKNDQKFVKEAIDLLYDREVLAERSSRGKAAPYCGEAPRPACTPAKKAYLLYLINQRVKVEAEKNKKQVDQEIVARATMNKVETYLTSKICTVRRDLGKTFGDKEDDSASSDSSDN